MASNKRMRGIAVHRAILIGSTATPLTPAEKLSADPLHTHKWTVAVRSAASNPLPTHVLDEASQADKKAEQSGAVGTRGRDSETDYHRHVGGKDDISHFIRRVQFKLHESFPQALRTCDRPPYQVSETGWGEFEVQVKIWWAQESGEKPLQTFHYLKLHPWYPLPVAAPGATVAAAATTTTAAEGEDASTLVAESTTATQGSAVTAPEDQVMASVPEAGEGDASASAAPSTTGDVKASADQAAAVPDTTTAGSPKPPVTPALPPVVHSWQYDEVVFPEPTEAFYQTLISHPPTPLPATPAQAFTDPKASSRLQHGFNASGASAGEQPPYPLHNPSSQPFVHGISQASIQAEADRLDIARIEAVRELEKERNRLIDAEKELRKVRARAEQLASGKA